jgi:hypothetical protein
MAAPRLRAVGIEVPARGGEKPDHRLYELLSERDPGDAHSQYNALIRQMVSFCRAVEPSFADGLHTRVSRVARAQPLSVRGAALNRDRPVGLLPG